MHKIFLFIYFIFQVLLSSVNAQSNYPVFVTPTLSPPYSLNLSDYSKFGSQKLMITIHINDLNISNLPVKLRIKLETTGVTIENPATIATTPIYIDGGSTSILFGNDLTDYFNINNLIFKGYSKETYNRTGQLPEGFYRFTVEVLHFNTNRVISNQSTTTAWIALGKPPVLKLPENNAEMGKFKGMPLTFSWLASNVGSPVSANTIQYKFEMWEMHVPGINPNVVAASMPVFHEHTDFNKMYSLYPANLLMKPGMQYAWRITASDLSGFVPFEQNGHSEIRTFIYKAACDSITNLSSSHRGKNGLFSWNPEDNHTSFNVEMRNPKTGWMTNSETYENKAEFFDLDYGATYEMRVQAVCDGDPDSKSNFSTWKILAIPTPAPPDTADCPDCVCDDDIPAVELQNFDIRNDLQPGDTIINKTGTSRFILKTVEDQGGGAYKGIFLFWAEIWKLKFICNYWDLQVNTDDVIVNMDFESVYDPQFLIDVDATIDYLDSLSSIITTLSTDIEIDDTLSLDESINTIYVNEGDSVIVVTVDDEGNITETVISDNVDDLEEILIEGENGEEYIVTDDGEIMGLDEYRNTGGGNDGDIDDYNEEKEENNLSEDITVNFTANENQKFGFDEYSDEKINLQSKYPSFNNGYKPAYKSIASFSTDIVGVSNSGSNIIFKDEMGIPAIITGEDITLRGSSNGADVALYAYQVINDTIEKIAGKLNVLSFDEQAKQLYIVPVNGATTPDETSLQEVLNKTYSQAITRWQVTKLENLSDVVFEETNMSHGGTTAISVYNKDQKTIVNTFEDRVNKLENNAYYLFFVENVQFKDRSIAGYMPLQRQVGFIYDNPGLNIIAHELGHGAFNLWHTFSPDNFIATEHTTQNLLDYKGGTDLWKHQWQLVQSPDKLVFGWLQDESEGEFVFGENSLDNIVRAIRNIRCAKQNNTQSVNLYFNTYSIPAKIKDLITAFNWAGSDVSDEEIEFYISNDGEINLNYFEDIFDIKNIQYDDGKKQIVFKGNERSLFVRAKDDYSDKKDEIYNFIKSLFNLNIGIKEPSSQEINAMELDKLRYLSICHLKLLNDENRKTALKTISEQSAITVKDEKLVLNLLRTTKNKSSIYSLMQDGKVSIDLYKGSNTYKREFVFLFNWICEGAWSTTEKQSAKLLFLGTDDKGNRFQLSENDWMLGNCLDDTEVRVWNLEDLGGKYSNKFTSAPSAPIRIAYFDGNTQTVSTFMIDYLRSQENKEEWAQAFFDYLNGVGLSSAGRLLVVKSTPALIRFLAIVEFGKTNIDIVFDNEELKKSLKDNGHEWFVNNWQTISTAIDIATFGSEIMINFAKKGDDLSKVLRENGNPKAADEIDDITAEAKAWQNSALISYKNIQFEDFAETVKDFENGAKPTLARKAYELWGNDDWDELYMLFKENDINNWNGINWPPFNGAKNLSKIEIGNQLKDKIFDRFQDYEGLGGSFASPVLNNSEGVSDLVFTYDSRALANNIKEGTYYYKFKLTGELPNNLTFEFSEAIPWFDLPGNADQIKSSISFDKLSDNVEIIEILKYIGGKWIKGE